MTVMEAILARKSIRRYLTQDVEAEKLEKILEAGRLAPSARNAQNWHFTVVRDAALRSRLADACCGQTFVAQAPVVLVLSAQGLNKMTCGQMRETVDCSIALSFMMLEAADLGLGTCWLGAFHADEVKSLLQLPEQDTVIAVSPLGYPAATEPPKPRKEMDEIVLYR